jgi:hypothetical protein
MPQAEKPAMTSGPGAQSRRTDGGPASKQALRYVSGMPNYGDGQQLMDLQASAPMASTPSAKPMPASQIAQAAAQGAQGAQQPAQQPMQNPIQPIPLDAPSQYPTQPVTHGADAGPGAGSEALILPNQTGMQYQSAYEMLQNMAKNPDASDGLKYLAQRIQRGY